jgi:hypothetical protein
VEGGRAADLLAGEQSVEDRRHFLEKSRRIADVNVGDLPLRVDDDQGWKAGDAVLAGQFVRPQYGIVELHLLNNELRVFKGVVIN